MKIIIKLILGVGLLASAAYALPTSTHSGIHHQESRDVVRDADEVSEVSKPALRQQRPVNSGAAQHHLSQPGHTTNHSHPVARSRTETASETHHGNARHTVGNEVTRNPNALGGHYQRPVSNQITLHPNEHYYEYRLPLMANKWTCYSYDRPGYQWYAIRSHRKHAYKEARKACRHHSFMPDTCIASKTLCTYGQSGVLHVMVDIPLP